jgi:hypothetical protein
VGFLLAILCNFAILRIFSIWKEETKIPFDSIHDVKPQFSQVFLRIWKQGQQRCLVQAQHYARPFGQNHCLDLPLAIEANTPPKHRTAQTINALLLLARNDG